MIATLYVSLALFLLYIALIVYTFSLNIRRWHDLGQSGWMSLLSLIPLINLIVLIYLIFAKGDEVANVYGEPNVGKPFWRSVFSPNSLKK